MCYSPCILDLRNIDIALPDAVELRRIAMQLHNWHEKECGDEYGCIERDETTNIPYWLNAMTGRRYAIPDKEKGAKKRLAAIARRYPNHTFYIQGDPRGASLYVIPNERIPAGREPEAHYTAGVAVYK